MILPIKRYSNINKDMEFFDESDSFDFVKFYTLNQMFSKTKLKFNSSFKNPDLKVLSRRIWNRQQQATWGMRLSVCG
jgi:hypothetical protein